MSGSSRREMQDTTAHTSQGYAPPSSRTQKIITREAAAAVDRSRTVITDPMNRMMTHREDSTAARARFFVFLLMISAAAYQVTAAAFAQTVGTEQRSAQVTSAAASAVGVVAPCIEGTGTCLHIVECVTVFHV